MRKTAKELFAQVNAGTVPAEPAQSCPPPKQFVDVGVPALAARLRRVGEQLLLDADDALGESPLTQAGFDEGDQVLIILMTRRQEL